MKVSWIQLSNFILLATQSSILTTNEELNKYLAVSHKSSFCLSLSLTTAQGDFTDSMTRIMYASKNVLLIFTA
jgi:hypothetical protein